ncbi:NADH dehydrogenase [ubiquinone] 1 subunit C2 [Mus musculus]|uniref:NADH dehydrogenase [ubiquinone] 1 subunit C2 n=1 Tax=Mus musculus TaxID=10090 RepID=NDUC2_MOUSE|nr:NADH dehydrogenase [ubiquinone] 1 subunit C2 [Mus musculus]Q9CQ54.1 RecName: Full=NADH dehydrogenase [ubiquinone] 1 subunit C2; AltName: Full=Complex I-B14.5b; Short=CI-B14.5b; AltName: Full=NADH-ubiquinone oxidoreductase subunit B14.5b [Mus musculus]6G2J_d Chain d, NADH dehydrogenase [ubiquinone] 1 subunit C2 [Mus musculus]6G72_d Chain d, NADH dehydrogenase [ubiquinone] 1 subunit C2 [Mus musculus]6ZR2_d Chain d, NADH dehydrogenase [ubiquinone] 1 subunit C2 [Mus musculus]6ZTQ_d Chain d, NAD|eukprot:NP_077182.1 NADH dehydrogenase [ubiquinone] 1 subunit C2 [Mus musculus]
MMNGRPGHEPLKFLPDEARSLPPPKLNDPRLVYMGLLGYCTGLMDNMLRMRPVMRAGLHRQLLFVTSFVFAGYFYLKRQNYLYAVKDHDMFGYIKLHPEDFPEKEKKTYAEILEPFHPVR